MGHILVVDDEEGIRFTLKRFLSDAGHEVSCAGDYDEGLTLGSASSLDLVFTDIVLGGKTGVDLLRAFREKGVRCPVVIVTGYPEVDTAAEAVRLGAFDYLPKPVTQEMVLKVAAKALEHKARVEQEEIRNSRFQSIFKIVQDGMLVVDGTGKITDFNSAAAALCALTSDFLGRGIGEVSHHCGGKCAEAVHSCLGTGEVVERRFLDCQRKKGPSRVVNLSVFPIPKTHDGVEGAVMMVRDTGGVSVGGTVAGGRARYGRMVGGSPAMRRVYDLIDALSHVPTSVLITGESGTGKELVAEALHAGGGAPGRPLVKVNCAAIPDSLLESELFGHVKGAFTGAFRDRAGRFQMAEGGTLFLDEIGNVSPRMQLGLLRVLQEREFERVGDSTPVRASVRIIAATNRDLREKVGRGEFREDLYYRLKVVEVHMPPLRDRREDIPLLADHFLERTAARFGRPVPALSEDALHLLGTCDWPGNVRELEHAIEHAMVLSRGEVITAAHLPVELTWGGESMEESPPHGASGPGFGEEALLDALRRSSWNRARAAKLLGVSERTVYRKIREFNLATH